MLTEYIENRRHVLQRNPNFRGEPYPCDGEPGDREQGLSRRLRQDDSLRRQGGLRHREGRRAAAGQVPAGLLRFAGHRAARLRHRPDRGDGGLEGEGEGVPRKGHQAPHDHRSEQLVHRLQLDSIRWSARATRPSRRSATASCARRCRSRSTGRSTSRSSNEARASPRRARCRRRCSATAPTAPRRSTRSSTGSGPTARRCGGRSRRRNGCWPRPATPTGAMRRPASRWCSISTT